MTDLQPVDGLFERAGWAMPPIPEVAHVVAYGQSLASVQSLPGVRVEADTTPSGIDARITISSGRVVLEPIHLCLGLFDAFEVQDVRLVVTLEPFARATLWAHGLFSAPGEARHAMDAEIHVMQGAVLDHQEAHFHGDTGAIQVTPRARVDLGQGACYRATSACCTAGWAGWTWTTASRSGSLPWQSSPRASTEWPTTSSD